MIHLKTLKNKKNFYQFFWPVEVISPESPKGHLKTNFIASVD